MLSSPFEWKDPAQRSGVETKVGFEPGDIGGGSARCPIQRPLAALNHHGREGRVGLRTRERVEGPDWQGNHKPEKNCEISPVQEATEIIEPLPQIGGRFS